MHTTEIDSITAELLHAAVHDLKGPAGRLRMLAQLLGRSGAALDDDARGLLTHIEDSAAAVGEVADGLRKYTEICSRAFAPETVDLNQALSSAAANLRNEMQSAGAELESGGLPHVHADPFLMTWLMQELLTNAVRFRGAEAPRIAVHAGDGYISVQDNGPGIDGAMTERVFRPFKKLSHGAGAGLGLTICRRIMETHGGRIWVEPHNGGADLRFSITPEVRP